MVRLRLAVVACAALVGCNVLFGVDDLDFSARGAGGAASSSSASSTSGSTAEASTTAATGGGGGAGGAPIGPAWLEGWKRRKQITFHASAVTEDLSDFPAPLAIVDAELAATAHPDGDDIAFTTSDGVTRIAGEIERLDQDEGTLAAWVGVPLLSPSADATVFLYYDNPSPPPSLGPSAVWGDAAAGVWHLDDDPGEVAPQFDDSSSGDHNGAGASPSTTPQRVAGIHARASDFDGSDDVVSMGDPADGSLDFGMVSFSFSFWAKAGRAVGDYDTAVFKGGDGADPGYHVHLGLGSWDLLLGDGASNITVAFGNEQEFIGEWTHLVAVVDRERGLALTYANGAERASASVDELGSLDASLAFHFGDAGSYRGTLDEVRVWRTTLSPAWIALEHRSLTDPESFLTVGPEEVAR